MKIKHCDFCSGKSIGVAGTSSGRSLAEGDIPANEVAIVDGPTRYGLWAYMCQRHLQSAGYAKSSMNIRLSASTRPSASPLESTKEKEE